MNCIFNVDTSIDVISSKNKFHEFKNIVRINIILDMFLITTTTTKNINLFK